MQYIVPHTVSSNLSRALYRLIQSKKHPVGFPTRLVMLADRQIACFRCFNQWRTAILSSFGYDPLQCPDCGHEMEFLELYYNHQRVSLEELYEKAMSKSRGKRSSS